MKIALTVIIMMFCLEVAGQVPDWVRKPPKGYIHDYYMGKGVSKTSRAESVSLANEDAVVSIVKTGKLTVYFSEHDSTGYEQRGFDANAEMNMILKTAREVNITGESKTIKGLKLVETYSEYNQGYYESWVLVSVPKTHPLDMPSSVSNTLKSAVIPGWGQFSRGSKVKGVTFLTLTAGTLISGFVLNELSNNASKDAQSSRTQQRRDFYNEQARTYNTFSLISFIAAVGFYIWNVADAIAIKEEVVYAGAEEISKNICLKVQFNF